MDTPAHRPARHALRTNPAKSSWGEAVGTPSSALAIIDAQLASVDADSAERYCEAEDTQHTLKMKAVSARLAALENVQVQAEHRAVELRWITHVDSDGAGSEADEKMDKHDAKEEASNNVDDEEETEEVLAETSMVVGQVAPASVRGSASARSSSRSTTPDAPAEESDGSFELHPVPKQKAPKKKQVCPSRVIPFMDLLMLLSSPRRTLLPRIRMTPPNPNLRQSIRQPPRRRCVHFVEFLLAFAHALVQPMPAAPAKDLDGSSEPQPAPKRKAPNKKKVCSCCRVASMHLLMLLFSPPPPRTRTAPPSPNLRQSERHPPRRRYVSLFCYFLFIHTCSCLAYAGRCCRDVG
jgi:hypothetical protein